MPITLPSHILQAKNNAKLDKKLFVDIQQKAVDGDSSEQCNYAFCCLYGIKIVGNNNQYAQLNQSLEMAETYACQAAYKGDVDALLLLIVAYLEGDEVVPKNHAKVVELLNFALTETSNLNETLNHLRNKLKESMLEHKQVIAFQLYQLGHNLMKGRGGKSKDLSRGITLLKCAADLGNVDAKVAMGSFYEWGQGVSVDLPCAKTFYCVAAMMGSFDAQYRLSKFFKEGLGGLPKDAAMAEKLLEAASFGTGKLSLKAQQENSDAEKVMDAKMLHEYNPSMPNGLWGKFESPAQEEEAGEAVLMRDPIALHWVGLNQLQEAIAEGWAANNSKPIDNKKLQENFKKLQENLKLIEYSAYLGNLASVYTYAEYLKCGIGTDPDLTLAHLLLDCAAHRGHLEAKEKADELQDLFSFRSYLIRHLNQPKDKIMAMEFDALKKIRKNYQKKEGIYVKIQKIAKRKPSEKPAVNSMRVIPDSLPNQPIRQGSQHSAESPTSQVSSGSPESKENVKAGITEPSQSIKQVRKSSFLERLKQQLENPNSNSRSSSRASSRNSITSSASLSSSRASMSPPLSRSPHPITVKFNEITLSWREAQKRMKQQMKLQRQQQTKKPLGTHATLNLDLGPRAAAKP